LLWGTGDSKCMNIVTYLFECVRANQIVNWLNHEMECENHLIAGMSFWPIFASVVLPRLPSLQWGMVLWAFGMPCPRCTQLLFINGSGCIKLPIFSTSSPRHCFEAKYSKAMECLRKDKDELLAFYDFPAQHWVHIRTTNPIESTFATVKLRTGKIRS